MTYEEFLTLKNGYNHLYTIVRNGETVWNRLTYNEIIRYKERTDSNFLIFIS